MDGDLWARIEPLLVPWPERSPGPRSVADRLCLQGVLYVLHNDMAWQLLTLELGFGRPQTDLPAQPAVVAAGRALRPAAPHPARRMERGRRARPVAGLRGQFPHPRQEGRHRSVTSRLAQGGSRHHVVYDGCVPRSRSSSPRTRQRRHPGPGPGQRHPPAASRTWRRPQALLGSKGSNSNPNRDELRKHRILPVISRKDALNIKGMGRLGYVVEPTGRLQVEGMLSWPIWCSVCFSMCIWIARRGAA
ncbi:transposase [Streptomyces sp. SF28]|nr:transposase [Streptomyces pinistramenti]